MGRAARTVWLSLAIALAIGAPLRGEEAADQYAVAAGHYAAERWQLACDEFAAFLHDFPQHEKAAQARFYFAESCVQLGKLDDARQLFTELLEQDGNSSFARQSLFRRGEAALLAGNDEAARRDLEQFHATHPRDELDAFVLPYLGELELNANHADSAREFYEAALKRFPKGPLAEECRFGIARSREQLGETDAARQQYEALAKDVYAPLADKAQFQLGNLHNAAGHYNDAIAAFDEFDLRFKESPLRPQADLARGWSLYKLGKHAEAREVFGPLTDSAELSAEAHYWIGLTHAAEKHWSDALAAFQQAAEADVKHRLQPAIAFQWGESLRQSGDLEKATQRFDALLTKWPDDAYADDALFGKLQVSIKQADHARAIALAEEFLKRFPKSSLDVGAECRSTIAICNARLDKFADAKQSLDQLRSEFPESDLLAPTTHQVAEVAFTAGNRELASELFTSLTTEKNTPQWKSRGLAGLAWSQLKAEDLAASASTFEKLIQEYPDDPLAANAALLRGQSLEKLGQNDAALAMYERVIDRYASSTELPQALLRAALLHDKLHQADEAAAQYRKLVDEHPQFADLPIALYHWGCLESESGHAEEAARLWQRVRTDFAASTVWADATYRLALAALDGRKVDDAEKLLNEINAKPAGDKLRPHVLYLQGRLAMGREAWDHVAWPLKTLATEFPDHPLALPATYLVAEATYRRGEYQTAEEQFAKLQLRLQGRDENWAPMVPLRRAQALAQLEKWNEAREMAEHIERDFPRFDQQYEADYLLGRCLAAEADFKAAREAYGCVLRSASGGKTETAAMAQWMIGETYFHQEDYGSALRAYLRVDILYAFPRWQAAALLQAGKCHEKLGQWKQAAETYSKLLTTFPNSEFSEQAAERLGVAQKNQTKEKRS